MNYVLWIFINKLERNISPALYKYIYIVIMKTKPTSCDTTIATPNKSNSKFSFSSFEKLWKHVEWAAAEPRATASTTTTREKRNKDACTLRFSRNVTWREHDANNELRRRPAPPFPDPPPGLSLWTRARPWQWPAATVRVRRDDATRRVPFSIGSAEKEKQKKLSVIECVFPWHPIQNCNML